MTLFYVYVLQSQATGRFYTGSTNDTKRRLTQHNAGYVQSTKFYRPWDMVYTEEYSTHLEAAQRERAIKARRSRAFIQKLIRSKA